MPGQSRRPEYEIRQVEIAQEAQAERKREREEQQQREATEEDIQKVERETNEDG
jgi:hypothetical protein